MASGRAAARATARLLRALGWAALVLCAAIGVVLAAAAAYSASSVGRPVVASLVVRQVDEALAGRFTLEGISMLPQGGVELRGLSVFDPDDHLVLQVSAARLFPDLSRLRSREVGLAVELDRPSVLLETEPGGAVSLARAFAPAHPAPSSPAAEAFRPSWTIRLTRLTLRGGDLWWQDERGTTRAEATGVDLDAEGSFGPAGGSLELTAHGALVSPAEGDATLQLAARLEGDRLGVPVLVASLGATRVEGLGEADLARRTFRAALTRLGLARETTATLAPQGRTAQVALAGDVAGTAYAESDGARATAALTVRPVRDGDAAAGPGSAAVAWRLGQPVPALGFDLATDGLDPARLVAQAPAGRVTLAARGAAAGTGLADGRGRVELELAASRLRGVEVGPATLRGSLDRGLVEVSRLEGHLPGLAASGSGRWRQRGEVGGRLLLDAVDLTALGHALTGLGVPGLPPLAGRLHAEVTVGGTAAAPDASLAGQSPWVRIGGTEVRALSLGAQLVGGLATLRASGLVAGLGTEPVTLEADARLAGDRRSAEVRTLTVGWPGTRYALARPARLDLAGPSVDRLELADGPRRLALEGGFGVQGAPRDGAPRSIEARVEARAFDLARLPRGLLPQGLELGGALDATLHATGSTTAPRLEVAAEVAGGSVRGFDGLALHGDATWDGAAGRLIGQLGLTRSAGGTVGVKADLPLPLGPPPGGPARARLRASEATLALSAQAVGWPLAMVWAAAGLERGGPADSLAGTAGARLTLAGTAAAPTVSAAVTVDGLTWRELGPVDASAALDAPGEAGRLTLEVRRAGQKLLLGSASAPLDATALLARPGATLGALLDAPLTAQLDVPGADLAPFAGRSGAPGDLAGTLTAAATLGGTARAPRGTLTVGLRDGSLLGYRGVAATVEATAAADRCALGATVTLGGEEALRATASLGLPVERLAERPALRRAPLAVEASVPPLSLGRAAEPAALATGQVAARLVVAGSLGQPTATLDVDGAAMAVEGRPLGDLTGTARYAAGHGTAELAFRATAGGSLEAAGELDAALGLDADAAALAHAPVKLRVTSQKLDLGFLAALLPGRVRSAAGPLDLEVTAAGPLDALAPRGTLRLADGRLALSEYGEWTGMVLDATFQDHAFAVKRLAARRGTGRVEGTLSVRDLGQPKAVVDGAVTFERYTVAWAGMDLVTLDLEARLAGALSEGLLDTTLTLSPGTVRLPRKQPRSLQSLERRSDITVGKPRVRRAAGPGARPFEVRLRVVAPGRLFVKGELPRLDVELKTDSTWKVAHGEVLAEGTVETVRGTVEPIDGRVFELTRGKVQFNGAGYMEGALDAVARYENPAAVVTTTVSGTLAHPEVKLSSQPPFDDATIAMLIATGRTDLKAGTSELGSISGKEAGYSAAGALVVALTRRLISDRLPVDALSFGSDAITTGKYLTDKIFVSYRRRYEARPDKGENPDEVRVEYQISPHWQLESRFGTAQSGGASLIWSRDY